MDKSILYIGILKAPEIQFSLHGRFTTNQGETIEGEHSFSISDSLLQLDGKPVTETEWILTPDNPDCSFTLKNVVIGIDFHWEQKENQTFKGALKLVIEDGMVRAINLVDVEDYIQSVVASEMSANAPFEFIKAHAIISRSWALAQVEAAGAAKFPMTKTDSERLVWYDKENHTTFDLCADDHCQRYQGITRISNPTALEAVKATAGEVLMFKGKICDTRFSKCCGGISEDFDKVWQPVSYPYLTAIWDGKNPADLRPAQSEEDFKSFLNDSPDVFCNTNDQQVLSAVLNDYDQRTTDLFRWKEARTGTELQQLILSKTGIDMGRITDLIPVSRGISGRLIQLKIVGEKQTITFGKELEIRRILSESHLYSSAFIVEKESIKNDFCFTLHGAGWGHGVGLCQIGAAAMSFQGYSYTEILKHYFRGAEIRKQMADFRN